MLTTTAHRLSAHIRLLVGAWVVLFVAIAVTAPHYNDAQRAGDPAAFRAVVEDGTPWRFVLAAVLDLGFAVAYGLLGFTLGWRPQPDEGTGRARLRRVAGTAVALGAVCDLAENVLVIANVTGRDTLTQSPIDLMRTLGDLKWLLGGIGGAVLVALLLADTLRRRRATGPR